MMRASLPPRIKLIAVLLLILAPLGILATVLDVTITRQREATEQLRRALEIIALAGTLESRLADMQVDLDGILQFGDEEWVRELERDYVGFLVGVGGLKRLVDSAQARTVSEIEAKLRAWRQRVADDALRVTRERSRAEAIWLSRALRKEMTDLRLRLSGFLRVEELQLSGQVGTQDDLQQRALVDGSLGVLAIGLAGGLFLLRERARSKRVLEENQERFRVLFEEAPIAYHEIDTAGVIRRVNRAECDLLGFGPDDLLGTPVWNLVAPEDREAACAAVQRKLAGEQPLAPFERVYLRRDGSRVTVEIHENLIRDPAGMATGIRSALLDITERKQAEARLRLQRAALRSAANAMVITDRDGQIVWVNPAFTRLTGYEPAEVAGQNPRLLKSGQHASEFYRAMWQRVLTGAVWHGELVNRRKDGSLYPEEMTITPVQDDAGAISHFIAIKQDISERKSVERMKDEFVSVVSHELRTPLTSIRGSLGLLAGGLLGPVSAQGMRMLEIAVSNTDRLVRLINDILDIERMESGKIVMNRAACDLGDVMVQAGEVMRPMAEKAGVSLLVAPLAARLWADADRILQVLTNLLSNAVKFSPPGGEVRLEGSPGTEQVLICVRDQGRGIPPDKLESVFERFQQVDASDSREKGGTGLGLAICRSIVSQHEGRIWAESVLGQGSTLWVQLPVWREPSVATMEPPDSDATRVLLCEGDPELQRTIREMLGRGGYAVLAADTPEAAVRSARLERPAAILLGGLESDRDGWTTLGLLKEDAESREIPVILISSMAESVRQPRSTDRIAARLSNPPEEGSLLRTLAQVGAGRTARVLVVEDDLDLAQILLAMFQRRGVPVSHAASGRDAIRRCQEEEPDLVVLDVGLPEGDGFAVVDWLRRHDRLRRASLVVYTARDLSAADRARLQLGQTEFLTKSRIPPEAFERHIVGLLQRIVSLESTREER